MVDHRIDFFAANFCVQYIWIEGVAFSPVGLPSGFWEKGGRYGKIEYVVISSAEWFAAVILEYLYAVNKTLWKIKLFRTIYYVVFYSNLHTRSNLAYTDNRRPVKSSHLQLLSLTWATR